MKKRRWGIVVVVIGICLVIIQCITFENLAPQRMKNNILGNAFQPDSIGFDSVFVRGFTSIDCLSGDPNNYFRIDLKSEKNLIKKKLKAKNVFYPERPSWYHFDSTGNYNETVQYAAYFFYNRESQPFIPCYFTLREYVVYNDATKTKEWGHETDYIWIMFFYVPIGERRSHFNY